MSDLSLQLQPATGQLPVSSYFDEVLYQRELETLFRRGPRYVGHALSVPEVGDYATLVNDVGLRSRLMELITAEFTRTRDLLAELFDGAMAERRPRMAKTLAIREAPLRVLHQHQIALLRQWRELLSTGRPQDADSLLPDLLLSINAIASGLRTTG